MRIHTRRHFVSLTFSVWEKRLAHRSSRDYNRYAHSASKGLSSSDIVEIHGNMTTMSQQEVVMVAERAVNQGMNDLRGELGVKFAEMEKGVNKFIQEINQFKSDSENTMEELNAAVTDSFKKSNELLRNENRQLAEKVCDNQN